MIPQSAMMGRRQALAALAATALTACSGATPAAVSTRSITANDPLAQFRLFSDAGPDIWARHMTPPMSGTEPCVLALSGGGEDGAFGAGALVGWSASGTRPIFDMVTGVSTGALIAPFAFLGAAHDEDLRRIFTEHSAHDIMRMQPFRAMIGDALYDTAPLASLIAEFTPPDVIDAIAARHASGARLFVVTSELDSAKASIWNMGAIAQAGQYDLFRGILRASAALPGLFSPVKLTYAVGRITYAETHIDGGVHMQFLAVPEFAYAANSPQLPGGDVFVVINNTLDPAPASVSRSALAISQQALTTSGRATAAAAVQATRMFGQSSGMAVSVASIDPNAGIVFDPSDRFSSVYMNALYRHGFERGRDGSLWSAA